MPELRRRRNVPNMRVSGSRLNAKAGVVDGLLERRAQVRRAERDDLAHVPHPGRRRRARRCGTALRETSPPIEWPTSATSSTATGHSATTASSRSASERPFSEMWRPLL